MRDAIKEWFERVDFRLKCDLPKETHDKVIKIMLEELELILQEEKANLAEMDERMRGNL